VPQARIFEPGKVLAEGVRLDGKSPHRRWQKRKEPPGNRAAPSSGRIVPTEAKPSELSGCIVGAVEGSVKEKSKEK
jgi:hypothetical protein